MYGAHQKELIRNVKNKGSLLISLSLMNQGENMRNGRLQEKAMKIKENRRICNRGNNVKESALKTKHQKLKEADDSWIKVDETFQELMDKYMDLESPCSTLIGEIIAAANKLIYRYYNDGDIPGIGYGNETCNGPLAYLFDKGVLQVGETDIKELIGYIIDNEDYYEQEIIRCLQDWVIDWWNDNMDICESPLEDGGWLKADIDALSVCDDCYRASEEDYDDLFEDDEDGFEESVKPSKKHTRGSKMKKIEENYSCKDYVVVIPYSDEAYNYLIAEFADTYMTTYDGEEAFLMQISSLRKFFEECDLEDDGVEVYEAPEDLEYLEDLTDVSLIDLIKIKDYYSMAFSCDER